MVSTDLVKITSQRTRETSRKISVNPQCSVFLSTYYFQAEFEEVKTYLGGRGDEIKKSVRIFFQNLSKKTQEPKKRSKFRHIHLICLPKLGPKYPNAHFRYFWMVHEKVPDRYS